MKKEDEKKKRGRIASTKGEAEISRVWNFWINSGSPQHGEEQH